MNKNEFENQSILLLIRSYENPWTVGAVLYKVQTFHN